MTVIRASAPGKIHLLGEHIVVYGKPALIAAIDKRINVSLIPRTDSLVEIISEQFQISATKSISEVLELTLKAREQWNTFITTKNIADLMSVTSGVTDYIFLAIGQSFIDFGNKHTGLTLHISSDIPVGSGCGSSSALAVTIAACIQKFILNKTDEEDILNTAVRIEEFKHGTPSGGDPATVLHGGVIWFEKKDDGKIIKPLSAISGSISKKFYLIDTGKPDESTGEMISLVRSFKDSHPGEAEKIFDSQTKLVTDLVHIFKDGNKEMLIQTIKKGEGNLESLGVVSENVKGIIRDIEREGYAAKISGGGGIKKGTGMLIVYCEDQNIIKTICKKYSLPYLQTVLGAEGLKIQ